MIILDALFLEGVDENILKCDTKSHTEMGEEEVKE